MIQVDRTTECTTDRLNDIEQLVEKTTDCKKTKERTSKKENNIKTAKK